MVFTDFLQLCQIWIKLTCEHFSPKRERSLGSEAGNDKKIPHFNARQQG
jgi:hypothetical protein